MTPLLVFVNIQLICYNKYITSFKRSVLLLGEKDIWAKRQRSISVYFRLENLYLVRLLGYILKISKQTLWLFWTCFCPAFFWKAFSPSPSHTSNSVNIPCVVCHCIVAHCKLWHKIIEDSQAAHKWVILWAVVNVTASVGRKVSSSHYISEIRAAN